MFSNMMPKKNQEEDRQIPERWKFSRRKSGEVVDMDKVTGESDPARRTVGIVFLDEIDKIAGRSRRMGPDVSRQEVQRDLLPIVEGCPVNTEVRHGAHRSYFVCRFRSVSHAKPVGPDPRVPGALPDPRRAEFPGQGRFRAHPSPNRKMP
jgi:ATP-dependent HslUV protease ATP-binding subunit HslU